jgi:hypothetical protein
MEVTVMEGGSEARGSEREGTGWTRGTSCFSVFMVTSSPEEVGNVTGAPEDDWIVREEVCGGIWSNFGASWPFWIVMPGGSFCRSVAASGPFWTEMPGGRFCRRWEEVAGASWALLNWGFKSLGWVAACKVGIQVVRLHACRLMPA